jgi:hypothetical protein
VLFILATFILVVTLLNLLVALMQVAYGGILENEEAYDYKLKNNLILDAEIALFWKRSYGAATKDKKEGDRKILYWADYSTESSASEADALSGLTESEKSIYEVIVNIKNEQQA